MAGPNRSDRLRKLERRIRLRVDLKLSTQRTLESVPAALQIVVGAGAAYSIAHFLLGHDRPLLSLTAAISTLGFTRDARPRRVLESVIGITVGIAFSEALFMLVGTGLWQLVTVLFATLLVARFFSASNAFAVSAGVQSMLVLLLPAPEGGVFVRSIDGAIGGAMALVVTALIPRDPRGTALRDARRMFSVFRESIGSVVDALRRADEPAAALALERLRRTQQLVDAWTASLDSAISIARISPFLRGHLPGLRQQARLLHGADMTARHLRVLARRIDFLVRDGSPRPALAELLSQTGRAVELLGESLDRPERAEEAAAVLREIAVTLDPVVALPDAAFTESVLVLLLRPLVVDLLVASGMTIDDARALLPPV